MHNHTLATPNFSQKKFVFTLLTETCVNYSRYLNLLTRDALLAIEKCGGSTSALPASLNYQNSLYSDDFVSPPMRLSLLQRASHGMGRSEHNINESQLVDSYTHLFTLISVVVVRSSDTVQ
ncbi:hypothetical protein Tco_1024808 [Tanacetum coccineum]